MTSTRLRPGDPHFEEVGAALTLAALAYLNKAIAEHGEVRLTQADISDFEAVMAANVRGPMLTMDDATGDIVVVHHTAGDA